MVHSLRSLKLPSIKKKFLVLNNVVYQLRNLRKLVKYFMVPSGLLVNAGSGHMLPSMLQKRLGLNSALAVGTAQ